MRPSLILSFAAFAFASPSEPLAARDFNTVAAVLSNVTDSVNGLSDVANSGGADPATLLKASDRIVQAIRGGTAAVNSTSNLTFIETVHLIAPVHKLSSLSTDLTQNMAKLKGSIEKQNLCDVVRLQIGNINQGATALIKAVNSKVPSAARDISEALSQGITDSLKDIQNDFSTQNCVNGRNETATSSASHLAFEVPNTFCNLCFSLVAIYLVI
ncbi:hypothetical protein V2A60_003698 [Cordyceps javanica]